uniref:Secreted protein n=1 Tax=Globodera pallida TaxID=36090 RepID=A0A183CJA9_GLOPA
MPCAMATVLSFELHLPRTLMGVCPADLESLPWKTIRLFISCRAQGLGPFQNFGSLGLKIACGSSRRELLGRSLHGLYCLG